MTCKNNASKEKKDIKDKPVRRCTISRIDRLSSTTAYCNRLVKSPFIRLSGKWLERAGFNIGDQIEVIVLKEVLLIQPAKDHQ